MNKLEEVKMALKRAKHFQTPWGEEARIHSKEHTLGPTLWNNWAAISGDLQDYECHLHCIHKMSKVVNTYLDNHTMKDDVVGQQILSMFVRIAESWVDWNRLTWQPTVRREL